MGGALTAVWYCTREDVARALDSKESARNFGQIDRAVEAASRSIEGLTHRKFYPTTAIRYFGWPDRQMGRSWRLWLDADELISITTLSSGGTTIASTDYFLEPANTGPPFTHIEIDLDSTAAFGGTSGTHQRNITISGVFGHSAVDAPAGTLAAAISSTTATTCTVSDSAAIGVGHLVKVDSERMIVTGKTMVTTSQTLQTPVTASTADVSVAVTTGSSYAIDEVILLDSERMLVVDIAGNILTVKRAWDGSVLAAHTGSTIFAARLLTVERGAVGTTAATHTNGTAITRHVVPGLIRQLAVAEAINTVQQETSAYARVIGTGEGQREASGRGLAGLRDQVYTRHGRKVRIRVV